MRVKLKSRRLSRELARSPLTLNRWAQRMGLSSGHLSDLVNGRRVYPRPTTRQKILDALDLSFEELFEIEEPARKAGADARDARSRLAVPVGIRPGRLVDPGRHPSLDSGGFMDRILDDVRLAVHQLVRRPGFTLAALITLALGIGANTAMFSLMNAALLKPYPYAEPEELVEVRTVVPARGVTRGNLSWPNFLDLQEMDTGLEGLAVYDWEPFNLAGGIEPVRVGGGRVSANLFDVIGVEPLAGRGFSPADAEPGATPVVLLGERVWREHFSADPAVVGQTVRLDGTPREVVGVVPKAGEVPSGAEVWIPMNLADNWGPRGANWLTGIGRLAEGTTPDEAQVALELASRQLETAYPDENEGRSVVVTPLREAQIGNVRVMFLAMLGAVGFLLLIVCANVANLLLARGVRRGKELAVRAALGAGRRRLVGHLATESLLLAAAGGTAGLLLGWWGVDRLVARIPVRLPSWIDFSLDGRVVAYALGVTLLATLLFGMAPALQTWRTDVQRFLRDGMGSTGSRRANRLRGALVVAEVALSLTLLVGAGLMIQSLSRLSSVEPGFEARGALVLGMDLLAHRDKDEDERIDLVRRHLERLSALPGVEHVGAIDRFPMGGSTNSMSIVWEGQTDEEIDGNPWVLVASATPEYFAAMGIPRLQGETLPLDPGADAAEVPTVVSRALVETFWPGENPIGRRFQLGYRDPEAPWMKVVGAVGDVRHQGLDQDVHPSVYLPYRVSTPLRLSWVLRTAGDPLQVAAVVREAVRDVDPLQPVHQVRQITEVVGESYWIWKFFSFQFWVFAVLGLVLASVGLYGVIAYSVAQRRREVGIRMALGARRRQVVGLVLRQGVALAVAGLVLGLPLAYGLGRLLSGALYGVSAFEPLPFLAVAALLLAVALLATWLPARRAARVPPVSALRGE